VRGRHYRAEAEIVCAGGTLPADVRESALTGAMEIECPGFLWRVAC
jgi:hypothetical protein